MSFKSWMSSLVLAVTVVALAPAQVPCFLGDDGFDTGCCKEPHPNFPKFPKVAEKGVYACLRNCAGEAKFDVEVTVGEPQFFLCDTAIIEIKVTPAPGGPSISGKLIAKYSRTWFSTFGGGRQVWRFLLNGDFDYGPSIGIAGCPAPPHANPSHVVGSIDYTCDPTAADPGTRIALNLSHLPGCISHGPLSSRPLAGAAAHNDRSYHLIAPNNFSFGVITDIQGSLRDEAVRSSPTGTCFPITYKCTSEADVVDGGIASVFKNCVCANSLTGAWVHQEMKGAVACGPASSVFFTVANFDPSVPLGLAALRLGRWSGPSWPGDLELSVYYGYLDYADHCSSAVDDLPEFVSGVGTNGVPGFLFGPSPVFQPHRIFLDLQDNLIPQTHNPIPVPGPTPTLCVPLKKGFGAPAYSSLIWNLNPVP